MIKYIVFDFDGTLADSVEIINNIVKDEFPDISNEDFKLLKEQGTRSMLKKKNIPLWKLPGLVLKVTSRLKSTENLRLFKGIDDLVITLGKKYQLGIVSSNTEENIMRTLKKYKIDKSFQFVYSQSSIFGKYAVLKKMCSKNGINPSEVLYIGDEDRDIAASKKMGMKSMAVSWGLNSESLLRKGNPDYMVNSLAEIRDILVF